MIKSSQFLFLAACALWVGISLAPLPLWALSLEDMMKSTNGQQPIVAAKPAPAMAPPAAIAPTQTPAAASLPTSAALPENTTTVSRQLPLVRGNCGFFSTQFGGCPKGGMIAPPNMPEASALFGSLLELLNTSAATDENKKDLIALANRLSTLNPQKLQSQLKALETAAPAYQFGVLKKLTLPETTAAQSNPFKAMGALVEDAMSRGTRIESGMQQALAMLKAMRGQRADPLYLEGLDKKIATLEVLAKTRLASAAEKQVMQPFLDSNGLMRTHPRTGKPITPQDLALTLTLLSLEGDDSAEGTTLPPAKTARQSKDSLENL
jgi:hypothetical protein